MGEAPLKPYWAQPSHPDIQKVQFATKSDEFTTKSFSTVALPPYALFAKFAFPPCTKAEKPTYATVQLGKNEHLNLNSDLVYINHGCEPSVIFDTTSLSVLVGPSGLKAGQELTFFYPSTEWDMAQGFDCFCGAATCKGYISGAKNMKSSQLEGMWLNAHIRELLEERNNSSTADAGDWEVLKEMNGKGPVSGNGTVSKDPTEEALKTSLEQARKMVDAAQKALDTYKSIHSGRENGVSSRELNGEMGGDTRPGVTSRELGGEMGGDTELTVDY